MDMAERHCVSGIEHVSLSADDKHVRILDQTQLPNREVYKELTINKFSTVPYRGDS